MLKMIKSILINKIISLVLVCTVTCNIYGFDYIDPQPFIYDTPDNQIGLDAHVTPILVDDISDYSEDMPDEFFDDVPDVVLDRSFPSDSAIMRQHTIHHSSFISRNPMLSYLAIVTAGCLIECASRWVWQHYVGPFCKSAWNKLKSKYSDYKEKRQVEHEKKEYYKELKAREDELEWKKRYHDISTEYARANVLRNKAIRELISTEDQ
ncbi:MAG: hypothetical protein LBL91_03475 [Lachnospiraceae bacterium]|jgi:hypothetical protein|nr:hypothetical protein [Lachnospiraceae bacterium]